MKNLKLKNIKVLRDRGEISIANLRYRIEDVTVQYSETFLWSFLELHFKDESFTVKGLKSIWEIWQPSTYDWMDKREDNPIFDLYRRIVYTKKKTREA